VFRAGEVFRLPLGAEELDDPDVLGRCDRCGLLCCGCEEEGE